MLTDIIGAMERVEVGSTGIRIVDRLATGHALFLGSFRAFSIN